MPNTIPHEYGCEDCDLMYHGIPVITESGEVLCQQCAINRDELLDTDPYEYDGYGEDWLDPFADDPTDDDPYYSPEDPSHGEA